MGSYFGKLLSLVLIFGSSAPIAHAQPSNTTVDYFFNEPATLWDLAELRIAEKYRESPYPSLTVSFTGLEYDWDTGVPSVEFSLDLLRGADPMSLSLAENICEMVVGNLTTNLDLFHNDTWGHAGFSTKRWKEKSDEIRKQLRVVVSIYHSNTPAMDPVTYEFPNNFEHPTIKYVICSTTGYGKEVSVTRRE